MNNFFKLAQSEKSGLFTAAWLPQIIISIWLILIFLF